jgi:bifunctional DNA-binding transcriptional regulator/antitoxin component of YhaV-PrlF toxin-antitoxin module
MRDFFRLKLVSKRQITVPQLMLEKLRMQEGDELEFQIEEGSIVAVRPLKLVPTEFFSESMLRKLEERSRSMDAGQRAHARVEGPLAQGALAKDAAAAVKSSASSFDSDLDRLRSHVQPSRNETKSVSGD